ncbi:PilZ domain-containing protein, partial [Pseudomonas gingeri]|nr:PilZ domain-containing protein [Pseudomonas gingeri]
HEDAEPTPQQLEALAREWVSRHASEFSHEAFVAPALD